MKKYPNLCQNSAQLSVVHLSRHQCTEEEEGQRRRRNIARVDSLTGHNGGWAVLLAVAVLHADGASVGLRLVGTQPLPLLLQPVLVLQVVLHVGLGEGKRSRWPLVLALEFWCIQLYSPSVTPLLFSGIHLVRYLNCHGVDVKSDFISKQLQSDWAIDHHHVGLTSERPMVQNFCVLFI